jgi:acyl-coenzyme A synthetase/AMP-(fatty) acid ligase
VAFLALTLQPSMNGDSGVDSLHFTAVLSQGRRPFFLSTTHSLLIGLCGRGRSGYDVRIADDEGDELPTKATRNLLLRSSNPNAFLKGSFGHPESTIDATAGLWLHTGDLAREDGDGNVYFMGRTKDVIRRRGENVNAAEVEEEFLEHPDIFTVAAYGVPSQFGSGTEEDLKVTIELRPGSALKQRDI